MVPVLAPLLVFVEGLTLRRVLAPGEAFSYNLPLHVLAGRMWRSGELPAWNVWSFSGSPLLATGQAGVFYPVNLLFVVLPPVVANNLVVVIGFALTGLGGFLLGRHLTGDPVAGAVTGLAFAFSGFFFAHLAHQSVIASAGWLPWMFYGFELLRERITPGRAVLGGGAVTLAFLGGHFQMVAIALLALGLYAGLVAMGDAGPGRPSRRNTALGIGVMVAIGLGLSAPQWLATLTVLDATDRAVLPFETATSYSLLPSHVPLLAFPYLFGGGPANSPFLATYGGDWNLTELSGYPGVVAFVLAAVGLVGGRRDRRVWVLLVLGVLAVLASMGSATFLGRWIYGLPIYGQFRSWGRFVVVLDLVVAVLAGYGVAACRSLRLPVRQSGSRRPLVIAGGATAAAVAVLAAAVSMIGPVTEHFPDDGPHVLARTLPLAAVLAAVVLVVVLARAGPDRRHLLSGVLCLVVLVDVVAVFGWHMLWRSDAVPNRATTERAVDPGLALDWGSTNDADGGIDRFLIAGTDLGATEGYPQLNAALGDRSVNGFDPLAPIDYLRAAGYAQYFGGIEAPRKFWQPGSDLLDLLRVTTVLTGTEPSSPRPGPGDRLGDGDIVAQFERLRFHYEPQLPDAFLVGATRPVGQGWARRAIAGELPFEPDQVALVNEGSCEGCPGPESPGIAGTADRRSGANTITVDVDVDRRALLVVSESWFPGWEATVDGRSVDVVRADGLLLGVPVPSGEHEVRLHYRPPGLRTGLVLSAVTALCLITWWALLAAVRRRRSAEHQAGDAVHLHSPR